MAVYLVTKNRSLGQSTLEAAISLFVLVTFFLLTLQVLSVSWTRWMMEFYGYRWVKCEMSLGLNGRNADCQKKYRRLLEIVLPLAQVKAAEIQSDQRGQKKLKVRLKQWGLNEATFSQTIKSSTK
jgi:hypothetical protein